MFFSKTIELLQVLSRFLQGAAALKGFKAARLHHRGVELRRDRAEDGALPEVRAVDLRIPPASARREVHRNQRFFGGPTGGWRSFGL